MSADTVAELMALADDYELLGSTLSRARLEQAIRRAVDSSLEAAKQEPLTGWRPIETAPNERALLFSPPEALWEDTTGKAGEMRVARPAEWTWARFWMPLPAAPSPGSGT